MFKKALLMATVLGLGLAAIAQEFPRAEVGVVYSYTRFSPSAHYSPNMNVNGGGGSVQFNVNRYFGVKAELIGGGASKATWTVPAGNAIFPSGATIKSSGNLFTYLFGPTIRIPAPRVIPYFNFLFGGAHTSAFHDAIAACTGLCNTTASPSGNSFGMAIGGGLDVPVTRAIAIKVAQVDYLMTRFNNGLTGADNQHNFRYSAGLVFHFGGTPPASPHASCSGPSGEFLPDDPPIAVSVRPSDFNPKHPLTYDWNSDAGNIIPNGENAKIDLTGVSPGTYTVRANVIDRKDKKSDTASCTASFVVREPQAPQVSCAATPGAVHPGELVTINVNGSTPDGRAITNHNFVASAGKVNRGSQTREPETGQWSSSATLDTTGVQPGPLSVTVEATDIRGLKGTCVASLAVEAVPVAPPPAPEVASIGQCEFNNGKKPARVDNACKATLDDAALRLQNDRDGTLVLIGFADETELTKLKEVNIQRALNVKQYLTAGEGKQQIDPVRLNVRASNRAGDKVVRLYFVPAGAVFAMEETSSVEEQVGK